MWNIELIEYPKAKMFNEIVDRLGAMIESGTCGQDPCTGMR
jgi:hypothetical protein